MNINFLGTNGWYADKNGNTICTFLETEKFNIVFDAGDGLHKLVDCIDETKPIIILISHLHLDHIIGLHTLGRLKSSTKSVTIYCPEGTRPDLLKILSHPFTVAPEELSFPISVVEFKEGINKIPFEVECMQLFHADKSLGYRISIEDKIITYLCDTGACDNALILSKNADAVIHECAMRPGEKDGGWGHSSPEIAATLAKNAGIKKIYLTHFAANNYSGKVERMVAQEVARKIFENTVCVEDDLIVEV